MRIFSYGGGVQSTAALVLAAQRKIDYPIFLFCNVGEDSEHPETLKYVRNVAMPYAKQHKITLEEIHRTRKNGEIETLYGRLTKPNSKSIGIPVRMNTSGAPGRRSCTADFKIAVVDKWLKQHFQHGQIAAMKKALILRYAIGKIDKETVQQIMFTLDSFFSEHEPVVEVGLGISLDEMQRVKPNMDPETIYWKVNTHPLIFEVPRPLTRQDCMNIITDAGLPVPPKSACWFCPYHRLSKWQAMRQNEPLLFWKAAALEAFLNERRKGLDMDEVWFTRLLVPLAQATTAYKQELLFSEEDEECEGYCFV
jgi:hypothetical protein